LKLRTKLVLFGSAALLAVVVISSAGKRAGCAYYGYQIDRHVKYALFVGCLVETPSGWMPKSQVITTQ